MIKWNVLVATLKVCVLSFCLGCASLAISEVEPPISDSTMERRIRSFLAGYIQTLHRESGKLSDKVLYFVDEDHTPFVDEDATYVKKHGKDFSFVYSGTRVGRQTEKEGFYLVKGHTYLKSKKQVLDYENGCLFIKHDKENDRLFLSGFDGHCD